MTAEYHGSLTESVAAHADRDAWPFAYIPTTADDITISSTINFIGGAEEAKKYLKQNCMTGVLSANYLTYFDFSGLRIDDEIVDRDDALTDPSSCAVMCRDNARILENQLKCAPAHDHHARVDRTAALCATAPDRVSCPPQQTAVGLP